MIEADIWIILAMVLYFVVIIAVGAIYTKRSNKSSNEYFIGGRTLGPWLTALSAEASDMSGWLLMGLPGIAYLSGVSEAGWIAVGLLLGTYLNWKFVAKRLRRYSEIAGNAITIPDYFSNRFHDKNKILMTISAVIIFIFFSVYVGSCFVTCGKLFHSLFGVSYTTMMIFAAFVVFAYTFMGGYLSVCTTDLIQSILMCGALAVVFIGSVAACGGVGETVSALQDIPGYLSFIPGTDLGAVGVVSALSWGLGYFGIPHVLVRFMGIKDEKDIKKSRIIAVTWLFVSLACAVCIGIVGRAFMPDAFTTKSSAETVFIVLSKVLLPSFLCGIVVTGILAASMSSSSSYLLISGSSIAKNIYKGLFKKDATDEQVMFVARVTLVIVMLFGIIIALDSESSIFVITSYAWAGFGASFGPLMLLSLYWKRTTLPGAVAGMITGAVSVIVYQSIGIFELYSLLPCFVLSALVIIVVSLLTKKPSKEILDEFNQIV